MGDTAWKKHERTVAAYFGVSRENRGSDFGQVGCEVVAPLRAWDEASRSDIEHGQNIMSNGYAGVIVECKQGYSEMPARLMRDAHKRNPDFKNKITLVIWGDYVLCWMKDRDGRRSFDTVWNLLLKGKMELRWFVEQFYIEWVNRKTPKYLDDFWRQSRDYIRAAEEELNGAVFPLVALHGKGMQGRIIVWRMI